MFSFLRLDDLMGEANVSLFRWGLSWLTLSILLVIVITLCVTIFFVYKKRIRPVLICNGVTLVISGVIFLGLVNAFAVVDRSLIGIVLSGVRSAGFTTGVFALVLGVVILILSVVLGVIGKKAV